jgi:hypothetical protein
MKNCSMVKKILIILRSWKEKYPWIKANTCTVFSLQILIGGDFRIIDGEKIQPRVRRPPVGSG